MKVCGGKVRWGAYFFCFPKRVIKEWDINNLIQKLWYMKRIANKENFENCQHITGYILMTSRIANEFQN